MWKKNYIKDLNDLEKIIKLDPYPCDLYFALQNRIFINIELGKYEKIPTDLKKLMSLDNIRIKRNPKSWINTQELIMHLGWANIKLGNYKEAEIYLNKIEKFYEGYNMRKSFLLILRGCARCNLDNYQLGINVLAEAKKLDKDLIFEDINYGYCKFKLINELPKEMKYFLGKNLHTFLKEI